MLLSSDTCTGNKACEGNSAELQGEETKRVHMRALECMRDKRRMIEDKRKEGECARQEGKKERPCICENFLTAARTRPPNRMQDCDEITFFQATL